MDQGILEKFKGSKVVVIGDVMLDKYLTGKIERISPEAPVPIVSLMSRDERLGGAANVTLSIKALEAEPVLFSIVGHDENGDKIKQLLENENISSRYIQTSKSRKTTVKSRILASNQQILRVDEEDTHELLSEEEENLIEAISSFIQTENVAIVVFQDYNKGLLTQRIISDVIELANQLNIPSVVDPKKDNFWAYKGITCFKPNLKEIRDALNIDIKISKDDLDSVHQNLNKRLHNQVSLITLSEHGIYYGSDELGEIFPTKSRKIADVCGAGDAVLAIISLCLAHQVKPFNMCKLANISGGQVCESVGVVPLEKIALCRELSIEE